MSMELDRRQVRWLVAFGHGEAVSFLDGMVARMAGLGQRHARAGQFRALLEDATWGEALSSAAAELRERHPMDLDEIITAIQQAAEQRDVPDWVLDLGLYLEGLQEELPSDWSPSRLRLGLILATQEIARQKLLCHRDASGEDFDDEMVRLGGADEMREIMSRAARGEAPVE